MTNSILNNVKKVVGIDVNNPDFDVDILIYINMAFFTLNQLGIGPATGYAIEDASPTWDAFIGSDLRLNSVKAYVCLRVRLVFDPPTTSYMIDSMKQLVQELEWRLNVKREGESWVPASPL